VADAFEDGGQAAKDLGGRGDTDVVFGEIDTGLQQRDQFQKLLFEGRDAAGDGTRRLLGRDAGLVEGGGFDEVPDGFRLGQVDAAV
jgi:hypothetical protein